MTFTFSVVNYVSMQTTNMYLKADMLRNFDLHKPENLDQPRQQLLALSYYHWVQWPTSIQADKSRQEHGRLYDCGAVIKTNHSSEQNSAFTSRHTFKVWPTTTCFNPLFTVNLYGPHGAFWVNNTPSHILHFPVKTSAARRHALYRRLWVQLSLSTMETAEQLPTAETHLTITQSSYVTQSQSKHAQHTHREGDSVTHSPTKGVWREMPNQKQKNVDRVRTLEAWEWNDGWDTTARKGFDQGNNVKQLRKVGKKSVAREYERTKKSKQEQVLSVQEHNTNNKMFVVCVCVQMCAYLNNAHSAVCREEMRRYLERFFPFLLTTLVPVVTQAANKALVLQLIFDPKPFRSKSCAHSRSISYLHQDKNSLFSLSNCLCVSVYYHHLVFK